MRLLAAWLVTASLVCAQERVDLETLAKIREESAQRSRVMRHLHVLADRYGPRLTGSPNYEAAARWAMQQLASWGLTNARLEPWDFGHEGWSNERAVPEDLKQASAAVAAVAWHLASREEMLPRFRPEAMPAPAVPVPPVTQ